MSFTQSSSYQTCAICGRKKACSKHHSKPAFYPHHPRRRGPIWNLCAMCHTGLHTFFNNEQLYYMNLNQTKTALYLKFRGEPECHWAYKNTPKLKR